MSAPYDPAPDWSYIGWCVVIGVGFFLLGLGTVMLACFFTL